jgi:hypothetical protein
MLSAISKENPKKRKENQMRTKIMKRSIPASKSRSLSSTINRTSTLAFLDQLHQLSMTLSNT